jgi:hypothetical protein
MAESEMVERVARAIYETWAADGNSEATWDELLRMQKLDGYPTAKTMYALAFKEARAAIEAMRKPTGAMEDMMEGSRDSGGWASGIDAALSPPSKD